MPRLFWAVALRGSDTVLNLWKSLLTEPFDPVAQEYPNYDGVMLKSSAFQVLTSAQDIAQQAKVIIEKINGIVRCSLSDERVEVNGILEVMDNGAVNRTVILEGLSLKMRGGVATVILNPTNITPQKSTAQKWLEVSETNELIADLLHYLSRDADWYDLYKIFECLRGLKATRSASDVDCFWPSSSWVGRFTHTANFHRHSAVNPARRNPPTNPVSLLDATRTWTDVAKSMMDIFAT